MPTTTTTCEVQALLTQITEQAQQEPVSVSLVQALLAVLPLLPEEIARQIQHFLSQTEPLAHDPEGPGNTGVQGPDEQMISLHDQQEAARWSQRRAAESLGIAADIKEVQLVTLALPKGHPLCDPHSDVHWAVVTREGIRRRHQRALASQIRRRKRTFSVCTGRVES